MQPYAITSHTNYGKLYIYMFQTPQTCLCKPNKMEDDFDIIKMLDEYLEMEPIDDVLHGIDFDLPAPVLQQDAVQMQDMLQMQPTVPMHDMLQMQPTVPMQPAMPMQDMLQMQPAIPMHDMLQMQPTVPMQDMLQMQPAMPMQDMLQMQPAMPMQDMLQMQPAVPMQDMLQMTAGISLEVIGLKQKLMTITDEDYLCNQELYVITANMDQFTDDELWRVPNVFLRGTGSLAVKNGCESMLMIKILCVDNQLNLRSILSKRFLDGNWCDCKCVNATGGRRGEKCDRERRAGYLSCSRHKSDARSPEAITRYLM